MRRHVPTVRRRRLTSVFSERDTLGLALPGLVCGLLGIGLVLWAQAPVAQARDAARKERAAQVAALRSASLANVGSGIAPVGSEGGKP